MLPPVALVREFDTHRLVLSRHLPQGDSVLVAISDDDAHLAGDLRARHGHKRSSARRATAAARDRRRGAGVRRAACRGHQRGVLSSASARQPLQRARPRRVVCGASRSRRRRPKSAFTSRFSSPRSAASKTRSPTTTTWPTSALIFMIFDHAAPGMSRAALDPDTYVESQALAERLLEAESLGVIYPSVRHAGGTCVACFRPALVANVRRGKTYRFTWHGDSRARDHRGALSARFTIASTRSTVSSIDNPVVSSSMASFGIVSGDVDRVRSD